MTPASPDSSSSQGSPSAAHITISSLVEQLRQEVAHSRPIKVTKLLLPLPVDHILLQLEAGGEGSVSPTQAAYEDVLATTVINKVREEGLVGAGMSRRNVWKSRSVRKKSNVWGAFCSQLGFHRNIVNGETMLHSRVNWTRLGNS